jgi:hypothetical protein
VFDSSPFDSGLFIDLLRTRHHLETLSLGYGIDRRLVNEVIACLAGPLSERLKVLIFLCSLEDSDPTHLMRLLRSAGVLRKLRLGSLPSNKSELLSILCNLDTLHDLELGHHISAEQVSSYLHQHPGSIPFSNVQTLSLQGQAQAAVMLLSSRTITSFSLEVQHPNENFYTAVSSMVQLLSLDITFPPNETVDQGGLSREASHPTEPTTTQYVEVRDSRHLGRHAATTTDDRRAIRRVLCQLSTSKPALLGLRSGQSTQRGRHRYPSEALLLTQKSHAHVATRSEDLAQTQQAIVPEVGVSWFRPYM